MSLCVEDFCEGVVSEHRPSDTDALSHWSKRTADVWLFGGTPIVHGTAIQIIPGNDAQVTEAGDVTTSKASFEVEVHRK